MNIDAVILVYCCTTSEIVAGTTLAEPGTVHTRAAGRSDSSNLLFELNLTQSLVCPTNLNSSIWPVSFGAY